VLEQQSPATPEPGDSPADRRRRNLPDRLSVIRFIGAVLAEQHDEWSEQRRYMGLEILGKTETVGILSETNGEEVILPATVVA
jgi:hypothetical protein